MRRQRRLDNLPPFGRLCKWATQKRFPHGTLIASLFFVAGCGIGSTPTTTIEQPAQRSAAVTANENSSDPKEAVWNLSRLEDGSMFDGVQQFERYVRRAQIAASGVLTDWNGTKGNVHLDTIIHGQLHGTMVSFFATGGFVRSKVGERVLILLALRDGEFKLHSYCAASGMYVYTHELKHAIDKAFEEKW